MAVAASIALLPESWAIKAGLATPQIATQPVHRFATTPIESIEVGDTLWIGPLHPEAVEFTARSDEASGSVVQRIRIEPDSVLPAGLAFEVTAGTITAVADEHADLAPQILGRRYVPGDVDATDFVPILWRRLDAQLTKPDGSLAQLSLARPLWWIEGTGAAAGHTIDLSVHEAGLAGAAEILRIEPCPLNTASVREGRAIVISTIRHENAAVVDIAFTAAADVQLGVTANHPIYSLDRHTWIPAGELRLGESVDTPTGPASVQRITPRPTPETVCNLEVHRAHCYRVSQIGILAHNTCPEAPTTRGGLVPTLRGNVPQADKWIRSGGRVVYHTDGGMTYIKNGISVRYNSVGYPDFSKYLYKGGDGLSQVRINLTGTRRGDFAAANAAAGFKSTPKGYTWHHHEDVGLMQLVETRVHGQFWHSGGFSLGQ